MKTFIKTHLIKKYFFLFKKYFKPNKSIYLNKYKCYFSNIIFYRTYNIIIILIFYNVLKSYNYLLP